MDDLAGLDWSASSKQQPSIPPTSFPPFRQNPTPQLSGRSTPLATQQSGAAALSASNRASKAPSKPATPANDSFAGLVSLNSSKTATSNLSLQERQKQLQEEKSRQEAQRNKQFDTHFGTNAQFWDNLGSGKSTPEPAAIGIQRPLSNAPGGQSLPPPSNNPFTALKEASKLPVQSPPPEDDLLAAFHRNAPVDASSHFPPPSANSGRSTPAYATQSSRSHTPAPVASNSAFIDDDDDLFGLNQLAQQSAAKPPPTAAPADDDDILGLLGKPVSEFERKPEPVPVIDEPEYEPDRRSTPAMSTPHDKAVAELVDMGFPADKSAIALATTESGHNVEHAVGWLLNQAHAKAKSRTEERSQDRSRRTPEDFDERPRRGNSRQSGTRESSTGGATPAWMRADEGRSRSGQRRPESQSQEKDVSQYASELGSTFLKSANSLWKTSQKKIQKTVAEFQQDGDPNVPKWMRDAQSARDEPRSQASRPRPVPEATDEAMMLEAGGRPSKPSKPSHNRHEPESLPVRPKREQNGFRDETRSEPPNRMSSRSPALRQQTPSVDKRPASKITRQDVEEQSAQAYVSPARRKKATPQPQPDLFASDQPSSSRQPTPAQSNNPFLQATAAAAKSRSPTVTPPPPRPRAPPRQIPPASDSALNSSASYRQKGSEAFKRGDYAAAHTAYCSALGPLPATHPVTIVVLCNRAVTNIKVGDPKAAVSDADAALAIIGVSRGEGEKIALGTEGDKDMKDYFGKALMRKAEALEAMEKWTDAGKVWRQAVEAGVGGSISIQGRNRCDKAAGGGNQTAAPAARRPAPRKPAPTNINALSDLGGPSGADSEAVKRLKAANVAAEKADDEKFALSDQVDATLIAWRGTKADNLRALLGSLDKVLWPEAGWNKVNMGDLVMPNKVKIVYMKAIAKVHPDKISQAATTEQRMISAAVFATLNEAWDKFKKDNGM
ncbi:hypothetical protein P280DRAFT_388378 [Massarina eburnea CBS 473.64]|uniref:UBA domain-containing protein n=1 Tax=Massarina eburnea CBS 473.64 TaxID=1395130 RepID=A0A6A6SGA2_9PLEO|nr:hypothetical protein P280DRAFT_388378 [Massarina eburnea CBS 473.64]